MKNKFTEIIRLLESENIYAGFDKLRELEKEEQQILDCPTYFALSDEQLANVVRKVANHITHSSDEKHESAFFTGAIYCLVNAAFESNTGELRFELNGMTYNKEPRGDWEIIVREI